jgi:hypothetical protein
MTPPPEKTRNWADADNVVPNAVPPDETRRRPTWTHGNGYVEDCRWFGDRINGLFAAAHKSAMSSRPEEFHLQALPEPYVNLSIHTAPDVGPFP